MQTLTPSYPMSKLTALPGPVFASLPSEDSGITSSAQALNYRMARDGAARDAYARIYGVEWAPLPYGDELDSRPRYTGPTTTAVTIAR